MKDNAMKVALVLDRSGSMGSIKEATVEGVNAFLDEQKASPTETSIHFVQFDDQYETVYSGPVKQAPQLTTKEPTDHQVRFEPRASTALRYAIGRTIDEMGKSLAAMPEADRPAKVVVAIMTDGYENASHTQKPFYSMAKISEMIQVQRDVYKWQFLFLGANQDAIATASDMSIPVCNTVNFAASAAGTINAVRSTSGKIRDYGITGQAVATHYTDEDRKAAMEEDQQVTAKQ